MAALKGKKKPESMFSFLPMACYGADDKEGSDEEEKSDQDDEDTNKGNCTLF